MRAAESIRDHKGVALVCIGISGINSAVVVALSPALPAIAREIGRGHDGRFTAQIVQNLPALAMIFGCCGAGYLTQRYGRRIVLFAATLMFACAGVAGMLMPDLVSLAAVRIVHGLAAGVMLTTSYSTVGEYFRGEARNRILGFCSASGSMSSILTLAIAGPMVDGFGWRSVFLLFLPTIALPPLILATMHRGLPEREPGDELSWRPILALWPLGVLQVGYTMGMFMSVIQVPFLAAGSGIASASTISLLVATTSSVAVCVSVLYGWLRRSLSFRAMFVVMSVAFGLGLLVCAQAEHLSGFFLGTAILGIGAGLVEPTLISRALDETPEALHDRAAGAAIATLYLGQFLNPLLVGSLAAGAGLASAAAIVGAAYLFAGLLFLVSISRRFGIDARTRRKGASTHGTRG